MVPVAEDSAAQRQVLRLRKCPVRLVLRRGLLRGNDVLTTQVSVAVDQTVLAVGDHHSVASATGWAHHGRARSAPESQAGGRRTRLSHTRLHETTDSSRQGSLAIQPTGVGPRPITPCVRLQVRRAVPRSVSQIRQFPLHPDGRGAGLSCLEARSNVPGTQSVAEPSAEIYDAVLPRDDGFRYG